MKFCLCLSSSYSYINCVEQNDGISFNVVQSNEIVQQQQLTHKPNQIRLRGVFYSSILQIQSDCTNSKKKPSFKICNDLILTLQQLL